jgi:hypothetical protein
MNFEEDLRVMAYFKIPFLHWSGNTEENHKVVGKQAEI